MACVFILVYNDFECGRQCPFQSVRSYGSDSGYIEPLAARQSSEHVFLPLREIGIF